MATNITMRLDPIAREFDADPFWYRPGETITGTAEIMADRDLNARSVAAILYWKTEGRGDKDEEEAANQVLHQGTLPAGRPMPFNISFTVPQAPWSYSGTLLHIHWFVEIRIDIAFGKDIAEAQRIIVAPAARIQPPAAPVEDSPIVEGVPHPQEPSPEDVFEG